VKTAADVKAELQACIAEFFELVEQLMDQGQTFQAAVISVCKARPDLVAKDTSLRAHLAALGPPLPHEVMPPAIPIEQSLSASELRAWAERQQEAFSCAVTTKLAGAHRATRNQIQGKTVGKNNAGNACGGCGKFSQARHGSSADRLRPRD